MSLPGAVEMQAVAADVDQNAGSMAQVLVGQGADLLVRGAGAGQEGEEDHELEQESPDSS